MPKLRNARRMSNRAPGPGRHVSTSKHGRRGRPWDTGTRLATATLAVAIVQTAVTLAVQPSAQAPRPVIVHITTVPGCGHQHARTGHWRREQSAAGKTGSL
jgi:hypothetical protein